MQSKSYIGVLIGIRGQCTCVRCRLFRPPLCALGIDEIDMQMHELTSFANHIGTRNRL